MYEIGSKTHQTRCFIDHFPYLSRPKDSPTAVHAATPAITPILVKSILFVPETPLTIFSLTISGQTQKPRC